MKNKTLLSIVYGIVLVVFSFAMFIVSNNKDIIFWTTYIFTIIGISGVYISSFMLVNTKNRDFQTQFPITYIASIYLIFEIFISLLFGLAIKIPFDIYCVLHIIILAIAVVITIFLFMGKKSITNLEKNTKENVIELKLMVVNVEGLISNAKKLPENHKNVIEQALNSLCDKLKYSDPIIDESLKYINTEISFQISKIEIELELLVKNDHVETDILVDLIEKTEFLIDKRNKEAKILK